LAFALNQGQHVTYWREEPLEIDAVIEGSCGDWAVEVKTGSFDLQAPLSPYPDGVVRPLKGYR